MRLALWCHPPLPTLQIWPLWGIPDHTRPRYGSRAAAAFAGKGVDPSNWQQLVWHRETDPGFGVTGQTIWIKESQGKGLREDNFDIGNIPHISQMGL